jgi:hypothetical protein
MENNFISISCKELSTIQRMLGQIEGIAFGCGDNGTIIFHAIEVIDEIFGAEL